MVAAQSPPSIVVVFATTNPNKLREVRAILALAGVRVIGLNEARTPDGARGDRLPEPVEDGDTFEANAAIKAKHYARLLGTPCLADDSGLEVDALDGEPGVRSARYAGVDGSREQRDKANIKKLLDALTDAPDEQRSARFVCAMCAAAADGRILAASRGALEGRIARAPRGGNGFGYDPLLELPDGRTCAQLAPDEKNAISHRSKAARALAHRWLRE